MSPIASLHIYVSIHTELPFNMQVLIWPCDTPFFNVQRSLSNSSCEWYVAPLRSFCENPFSWTRSLSSSEPWGCPYSDLLAKSYSSHRRRLGKMKQVMWDLHPPHGGAEVAACSLKLVRPLTTPKRTCWEQKEAALAMALLARLRNSSCFPYLPSFLWEMPIIWWHSEVWRFAFLYYSPRVSQPAVLPWEFWES